MFKLNFRLDVCQVITAATAICQINCIPISSQTRFNYSYNENYADHEFNKQGCDFPQILNSTFISLQGFNDFPKMSTDDQYSDPSPFTMFNETLKVAIMFTTMEFPFKAQLQNGTLANIYGNSIVAFAFLLDLQEIFQFKIEIVPSVGWISEGVNGAITGAGAQVHYGEATIGLDISKPVVYRAKHLAFLHAIKHDRVAIMFKQPKIKIYRNILGRPFKDGLWIRVLQFFFAIFLTALLISRRRDMHTIFISISAAMLARSVNLTSVLNCSSRSLHVVFFVTSLFGFTMYSIYSAFIVSSLKKQAPPVRKFQDLINFEYELMAHRSLPDFTNVYLSDPKEGSKYAKIAKKNFISEKNSLRRLFDREAVENDTVTDSTDSENGSGTGIAWFVLKSDFYYLAIQNNYSTREICSISKLEPTSRPEHPRLLAMYIAKQRKAIKDVPVSQNDIEGGLLREHFNRRILDILSRGLGHRHILGFESEFQPKCLGSPRPQLQQIRFYDVYAAYYVLCCGAIFALSMMVGEILFPYLWKITEKNLKYGQHKHRDRSYRK